MTPEEYLRLFVDVEACDDGSQNEEEEEDLQEMNEFIDDTDDINLMREKTLTPQPRQTTLCDESPLDTLLDGILRRARQGRVRASFSAEDTVNETSHWDKIRWYPSADDYPLWKVKCRLSVEEEAVFFLARATLNPAEKLQWQIRSSFVCEALRGWIFIEGVMDQSLEGLIKRAPGVVQTQFGIYKEQVDFLDWIPLLKMQKPAKMPKVGDWVCIRGGTYGGDIGLVYLLEQWGAYILLVPRFDFLHNEKSNSMSKRKRGSRTPTQQCLFDYNQINLAYNPSNSPNMKPKKLSDTAYLFRGVEYHYGLVLRKYSFRALSTSLPAISISPAAAAPFLSSHHPLVLARRHALQWIFFEGERVKVMSQEPVLGVVKGVSSDHIEVELSTNEGVRPFSWTLVEKVIQPGDYVEVVGGPAKGKVGWVLGVADSAADIAEIDGEKGFAETIACHSFMPLKRHVNSLRIIEAPFHHQIQNPPIQFGQTFGQFHPYRVPWLKIVIAITKKPHQTGHPLRGELAIVEDVLYGQETPSGLRLKVRLVNERYNPNIFCGNTAIIDYDFAVEKDTGYQLFDFKRPPDDAFHPADRAHGHKRPPDGISVSPHQNKAMPSVRIALRSPTPQPTPTGTPLWTRAEYEDLHAVLPPPLRTAGTASGGPGDAWADVWGVPSPSTTPTQTALPDPPASANTPLDYSSRSHHLSDRRLVGVEVKVKVTRGRDAGKEIIVTAEEKNGAILFQRRHYKQAVTYAPEDLQTRSPNPTRDNGPLVVIKGEHCGRRVRRIHHRYSEGGQAIMRLAVVGQLDTGLGYVTGEEIELVSSELCIGTETKEQKENLDRLLRTARDTARKIRAK